MPDLRDEAAALARRLDNRTASTEQEDDHGEGYRHEHWERHHDFDHDRDFDRGYYYRDDDHNRFYERGRGHFEDR